MKRLELSVLVVTLLSAVVFGECYSHVPVCPPGSNLTLYGVSDWWACCDQTHACPRTGNAWARIYRREKRYMNHTTGRLCTNREYEDTPPQENQCCGDPIAPGPDVASIDAKEPSRP